MCKFMASAARCLGILLVLTLLGGVARGVTFRFEYTDPPDTGFFDPATGSQRRSALEYAASILESVIAPRYAGETIVVQASHADQDGPLASGSAGNYWSDFAGALPSTQYGSPLANHLAGVDLGPALVEARIRVNTDFADSFYYGTYGGPSPSEYDFVSVAVHELMHGLNFDGSTKQDGSYSNDVPGIFDRFVRLGVQGPDFVSLSQSQRAAALSGGNLFWGGAEGILGNGIAPKLHAPSTYAEGSTLIHLDEATMGTFLMSPSIAAGQQNRFLSPAERGMLRDMGWNIAVKARDVTWNGLGGDDQWSTAANWEGAVEPLGGDDVIFGASSQSDVQVEYGGRSRQFFQSISFESNAPQYTLRVKSNTATELIGLGFLNSSGATHNVILETFQDDFNATDGADLLFRNNASAGNLNYVLHGDVTVNSGVANEQLQRHGIARIEFRDASTAGEASFDVEGGAGDGAFGGIVGFHESASAFNATIRNRASRLGASSPIGQLTQGFSAYTEFKDSATANGAAITNDGGDALSGEGSVGGITRFSASSTAGGATVLNRGAGASQGIGGRTTFGGMSTAGSALITNEAAEVTAGEFSPGFTVFFENSTAAASTIDNLGSKGAGWHGGVTRFREDASAGTSTIHNRGSANVLFAQGGVTEFRDNATAGAARIRNYPSGWAAGRTEFHDFAIAGTATIDIEPTTSGVGGAVHFYDDSSAATANIRIFPASASSFIRFDHHASAGNAHLEIMPGALGSIDFVGSSTAQNSDLDIGSSGVLRFLDYSAAAFANIEVAANATAIFNGGINVPGVYSVTADNATITVRGGGVAGRLDFSSNSTAGSAQIAIEGGNGLGTLGGFVSFGQETSSAGSSTILVAAGQNGGPGGRLSFSLGADADLATIITQDGAVVDLLGNRFYNGTSIGSLAGTGGQVLLQSHLTVGGLGLDATFNGALVDPNPTDAGGTLTKIGGGQLALGGDNSYAGVTTVTQGTLLVNGSILGGAVVEAGAVLGGGGTIEGGVIVLPGGTLSPGTSPGTLTVDSLVLQNGSQSLFEVGTQSDEIVAHESLTLGGTLVLAFTDGFFPELGDSFVLFSGTFGAPTGEFAEVLLPPGIVQDLDVRYTAGQVTLNAVSHATLRGDFDSNGVVDGRDLLRWQRNPSVGNFTDWQSSYGLAYRGLSFATSAPEPAGLSLGALLLAIGGSRGAVCRRSQPLRSRANELSNLRSRTHSLSLHVLRIGFVEPDNEQYGCTVGPVVPSI